MFGLMERSLVISMCYLVGEVERKARMGYREGKRTRGSTFKRMV